jgi:2-(3-amino-3-carboxypropyl)histidine synthase
MKILHIETRKKIEDSDVDYSVLNTIEGKTVSIAATIQYIDLIPKVKKYLEGKGKEVLIGKGVKYLGHVLGCNAAGFDSSADALLLITDGKFHGINNAIQLDKELYIFDMKNLEKIEKKEIEGYKKRTEAKKKLFLTEKNIGLLLSSKPGQKNKAIELIKKNIEKTGKKVYVFEVADKANKRQISEAIKIKFGVAPIKVNTVVTKPKAVIRRGRKAEKAGFKKAYVYLHQSDNFEFV